MLEVYNKLAKRLRGFMWVLWLLAGVAIIAFAATLLLSDGSRDELYTLSAVCLLLWSLSLVAFVRLFEGPVPNVWAGQKFFARLTTRIRRGVRWIAALTMTTLFCVVIAVSFRAASILG